MKESSGVMSLKRLLRTILIGCLAASAGAVGARAQDADQVTAADVANEQLKFTRVNPKAAGLNRTQQATLPGIAGVDTVPNFSGAYSTLGFDPNGKPQSNWLFNTLGKRLDGRNDDDQRAGCAGDAGFAERGWVAAICEGGERQNDHLRNAIGTGVPAAGV
jgi:hypothetical protein